MDDKNIIDLFWHRSESAVDAVSTKYGKMCRGIAENLLRSREDAEECVNDTWHTLWQNIPPQRPDRLQSYVAKITRNLAMKRLRQRNTQKRAFLTVSFEELSQCIPSSSTVEQRIEEGALTQLLEEFLRALDPISRNIFLRRYWFFDPVREIAERFGLSVSGVKMRLLRTRNELKKFLEEEQIYVE